MKKTKKKLMTAQDLFMEATEQVYDYTSDPPIIIGYLTTKEAILECQSILSKRKSSWETRKAAMEFLEFEKRKFLKKPQIVNQNQQFLF